MGFRSFPMTHRKEFCISWKKRCFEIFGTCQASRASGPCIDQLKNDRNVFDNLNYRLFKEIILRRWTAFWHSLLKITIIHHKNNAICKIWEHLFMHIKFFYLVPLNLASSCLFLVLIWQYCTHHEYVFVLSQTLVLKT